MRIEIVIEFSDNPKYVIKDVLQDAELAVFKSEDNLINAITLSVRRMFNKARESKLDTLEIK